MLRACHPPLSIVLQRDVHRVLALQFGEFGVEMLGHEPGDVLALHVGYSANGEFARHFSGDDGFGAGSGEGAFDAVDGEGRVTPSKVSGQCRRGQLV